MSVEVVVPIHATSSISFGKIVEPRNHVYGFGTRDSYDVLMPAMPSSCIVVYDLRSMGRGVEISFNDSSISLRLCTPSSTSDLDTFKYELKTIIRMAKANEVICEDEIFSIQQLNEIFKLAEENLHSGLDFISSVDVFEDDPIDITTAKVPIAIDSKELEQFRYSQEKFNSYLHHKQCMNGINAMVEPLVFKMENDISLWMVSIVAGRYIILPSQPRVRNPDVKADYFLVHYNQKTIFYRDFLNYIDISQRFDAARFIAKFTKAQIEDIFNKFPDAIQTISEIYKQK